MTREVAWQRSLAIASTLLLLAVVALIGGSSISAAGGGLVAAYSFDEGSGTTLTDRSGNGNAGSISGAAWTAGRTGGALSFDGVNDVVNIADSDSLDITQMTLEAWVRLSTLGNQWRTVVIKEKPKQLVYALYAYTNGPGAAGNVNVTGGTDVYAQASSLLPTKTWVHLAATYDGATVRLYANGSLIATKTQAGKIVSSTSPMRIGGNTIWGEWFAGQIDDLRVYNRPLSADEIKADMDTPVTGGGKGGSTGDSAGGTSGGTTADTQPPTTPGVPSVTASSTTSVWLTWSASSDDVGVVGYQVYNNNAPAGTTSGTSYNVSGLLCGTSYTFAVDAYDAAGNRSGKSLVNASTSACPTPVGDTKAPTVPANLSVVGSASNSISVAWSASIDDTVVSGYGVYRDGFSLGSSYTTSYTFTGLICGVSYTLSVDAYDAAGNRSAKSTITGSTSACAPPPDTQAPTQPGNVTIVGRTDSSVSLSWSPSLDDTGVVGYGLYRNGNAVGSTPGTTYTFAGLACGTAYTLAVDAYDAAGNRSTKPSVTGTTSACATPSAPASGTANLWVDTNGGSCARQASAGAYVDAQACGSLNAAYQAAQPGDRIDVKGGTYPGQSIDDRTNLTLGSTKIEMHPAPGESVLIDGGFIVRAHDLVIDGGDTVGVNESNRWQVNGESITGLDIGHGSNSPRVTGVIVEDVHTRNVYFDDASHGNNFRYGEVGPSTLGGGNLCADLVLSGNSQFTVEYNNIHDNKGDGCGSAHIDAMDLDPDDTGSVVRGNRIWWCGTQCIFSGDPGKMLIENNMIEETNACGSGCAGPQELAVMGDVTVRYNTIEGDDGYGRDPDRPGNATVYGNVFLTKYTGCAGGGVVTVSYDNNVFPPGSVTCGTNARFCVPRLASTGNLFTDVDQQADYHLASTDTCALGVGKATDYPARDLDAEARPLGGFPDAGADER